MTTVSLLGAKGKMTTVCIATGGHRVGSDNSIYTGDRGIGDSSISTWKQEKVTTESLLGAEGKVTTVSLLGAEGQVSTMSLLVDIGIGG